MMDMNQKIILMVTLFALALLVYGQTFEGFANPQVSSSEDVSGGASDYYNWGYKEIPDEMEDKVPHTRHHCPRCRKTCYIPVPYRKKKYPCPHCQTKIHIKNDIYFIKEGDCNKCDITQNKDIGQYVLKSSVPPCADMSQYVKKSQLKPQKTCSLCPICPSTEKKPDNGRRPQTGPIKSTLRSDYRITSESRRDFDGFGASGDEEPGPGYRTGAIPKMPGNDLGLDDHDVRRKGTTPKAGMAPEPYAKDFAYNNRGSGRVKAYNSVWSVFG